ncbi:MAG TPA: PIN domain-containing protein [Bacteroidia bacterium]|nr:PIN domain-containing protein [Bacteroidia bacterium]
MLNLYIDTNAYLTFYHLTSDDLEELKKLHVLISGKKIKLHLPEQTYDEFKRNREVKIADALKRFREEKLNNQFPQICKDYPEYEKTREAIKEFGKNKSALIEKILIDIEANSLLADEILNELFDKAIFYNYEGRIINSARLRYDLGKPPGKNKSYGDAINWETLLENTEHSEDLYFISDDGDFYSEIDSTKFNSYLINEWRQEKRSNLYHYRRISEFFKDKFPSIKIASDYEKDILLKDFGESHSFANSRAILKKLSKFDDFSSQQINDFATACLSNNQIYWIKDDVDIKEYVEGIIHQNKDKLDPNIKSELKALYDYLSI